LKFLAGLGVGCSTLVVFILGVVGVTLIDFGSSSGANDPCKMFPEDGYCSLQEISRGVGWVLVSIALLGIAAGVAGAVRASNRKNRHK
jgi:hypothetical protein